jgi:transketolase
MDQNILAKASTIARGLSLDAVNQAKSGHLGLPLGATEIGAVLFGLDLRYHPAKPKWINRDRFVLSAGHGSMFLYSWLHLAGYDISLEDIKNFRQLHSKTPGHPEFHETDGVEATTGPLGQGIGNAVGYALSGKMAAATFNTAEHKIFDHHVIALAGDGCMQEGVAFEAISFAGHNGLDNLILIYDSNDVTLDAMAEVTQSEDTGKRFEAMGWDAVTIDGHDFAAIHQAISAAKANDNGRPKLIIAKTEIARGIPEVAGTAKGHGEGGVKFAAAARQAMGLPAETFYVSPEVRDFFAQRRQELAGAYAQWEGIFTQWAAANPDKAKLLQEGIAHFVPADLMARIPEFKADDKVATRNAGGVVLQPIAEAMPLFITGSADLYGSTKNYLKVSKDFKRGHEGERNIWFGIREHGMGAIMNGIAYDGLFRPSGATFAVFADYLRPSIRLAALAHLPVLYIFTHDSVGVGEDGPTHQPVETCSGLRVIPGLDVIRPGDAEETAGAFVAALQRIDGPTVLLLSRQDLPVLSSVPVLERREGVARGAYIAKRETGPLKLILMATGSELQHVMVAAQRLGDGVRVVSMPCMERFDRQSIEYREDVLPSTCRRRLAVEAGVSGLWYKYVGLDGAVVGIDRFGLSAPGDTAMEVLGMTAENVVKVASALL